MGSKYQIGAAMKFSYRLILSLLLAAMVCCIIFLWHKRLELVASKQAKENIMNSYDQVNAAAKLTLPSVTRMAMSEIVDLPDTNVNVNNKKLNMEDYNAVAVETITAEKVSKPVRTSVSACSPGPALVNVSTAALTQALDGVKDKVGLKSFEESLLKRDSVPDTSSTLHVIVVPHSHNDPGWHKTVTQYFEDQSKYTLTFMVKKMVEYPNMTFVWPETVFLDLLWQELEKPAWTNDRPEFMKSLKSLIASGRLEIVVGSWVVPDEATPHYAALVDQIIEGHWWLRERLGIIPRNTWSLDPFGYSATLPYLYKRVGFKHSVILRVHNIIKGWMGQRGALDFAWRQQWDAGGDFDLQTLLMPYQLYNIKHTCGPNTEVCLHYDFRNIPGESSESLAEPVTPQNVAKLAEDLIAQYRLKASLFRHNVVLIPLGDDFRFDHSIEWDQQYKNYMALFDYINQQKDWNVNARFGTVSDYFTTLQTHYPHLYAANGKIAATALPTVGGDFFPYSDQQNQYWTGYYTTRPYLKVLGRELEYGLRVAEMVNVQFMLHHRWLSNGKGNETNAIFTDNLEQLRQAHRALGLFQHHDATTGTARYFVAKDYEDYLKEALSGVQKVMAKSLAQLAITPAKFRWYPSPSLWFVDPVKQVVAGAESKQRLVFFNPTGQARTDVIRVTIDKAAVSILNNENNAIDCQINPVWKSRSTIANDAFELVFVAHIPAFGYTSYVVYPTQANSTYAECERAYVKVVNSPDGDIIHDSKFNSMPSQSSLIVLQNRIYDVRFSPTSGLLQTISAKNNTRLTTAKVATEFLMYKSRSSGAYIFEPTGPAIDGEIDMNPVVRVVKGELMSEVHIVQPLFTHRVSLSNCNCLRDYALEINNVVDLTTMVDKELIMRLSTNLAVQDSTFYTDSNGFQMMRRQRLVNFLNSASYYPMTTAAFLEDRDFRLTILSAQSLGLGSHKSGAVEVMLDRRLSADDGRGLGEGVYDNRPTPSRFYLVLEALKSTFPVAPLKNETVPQLSPLAHLLRDQLRNYVATFTVDGNSPAIISSSLALKELPCLVSLVSLRCLTAKCLTSKQPLTGAGGVGVVLRREAISCDLMSPSLTGVCQSDTSAISLSSLFKFQNKFSAKETTLNFIEIIDNNEISSDDSLTLAPIHLHSFRLTFS